MGPLGQDHEATNIAMENRYFMDDSEKYLPWNSWYFYGISWYFNGISWDFNGISISPWHGPYTAHLVGHRRARMARHAAEAHLVAELAARFFWWFTPLNKW